MSHNGFSLASAHALLFPIAQEIFAASTQIFPHQHEKLITLAEWNAKTEIVLK